MFGENVIIPSPDHQVIPFLIPFGIIGVWRWGLFLLRVIFWLLYRPLRPKKDSNGSPGNKYKSSDVTIIVPTIDNGKEFVEAAKNWQKNKPAQIIIVTSHAMKREIQKTCQHAMEDPSLFRVLSVPHPNKRVQLMKGVHAAETPIVALSDDDAIWTTSNFLEWMLAPFDDDEMGGVGSKQEMMPTGKFPTVWEVIADFRLTMRMIETCATTFVDGGMSCLSGRTAVYRTEILRDPNFEREFVNEKWMGKYPLHSGDDKFITRWLVKNDWKMRMQNHKEATLLTTFKPDRMFVKQVLRWTRNTWRSDIRSVFVDRKIWCRHPYVAFNMIDKFLNPFPLLFGVALITWNTAAFGGSVFGETLVPVFAWLIFTRLLKLIPHLIYKPSHIVYLPAMVLFQYFFAVMKLYALFTLHITDWGSRASADDDHKDVADEESGETAEDWSSSDLDDNTDPEVPSITGGEDDNGSESDKATTAKNNVIVIKKLDNSMVPWYKRVDGWVGAALVLCAMGSVGYLVHLVLKPRWTMRLIVSDSALSSDRATGAAFYDATTQTTFLTYAGPNLDPTVTEYQGSSWEPSLQVGTAKNTSDYHDYPMMAMNSDGKLIVIYTDSPDTLHMSRALSPHAATHTEWQETQINDDNPTYPCIITAGTNKSDIYVFYRRTVKDKLWYDYAITGMEYVQSDYRPLAYIKSTDGGVTWSSPRKAVDTGGFLGNRDPMNLNEIYFDCPRYESATETQPERFAMGWTLAGGGPGVHQHNHYHKNGYFAYFIPTTETFESVTGEVLGPWIGYPELEACLLVDSGPLDEDNKHAVDYYFAPSYINDDTHHHHPIVVYNMNRTLYSATWTGFEWSHSVIQEDAAKNGFDIQKLGNEEFRVFHPQGNIKIHDTTDGGVSWSHVEDIQPPSEDTSVNKVIMIQNAADDSMQFLAYENDWTERNYNGTYRIWSVGME